MTIGLIKKRQIEPLDVKYSYTAFISHAGTDAPTAIVVENGIGEVVWSYVSAGVYHLTLVGAFVSGKTAPIDDIMMDQIGNVYTLNRISADIMELKSYAAANLSVTANGVLSSRYINIEVYI
jgi:hypothetical protein